MATSMALAAADEQPKIKRKWRGGGGDLKVALLFIAPALIGLIFFYIVPTARGLFLSFTEYSVLNEPKWVGGDNYARIVQDPLFWNAMGVTVYYVVINIVLQTALALGLALLMLVMRELLIRAMQMDADLAEVI